MDRRCSCCRMLFHEEELLIREDNGARVCPECSGLLKDDIVSCAYDEDG